MKDQMFRIMCPSLRCRRVLTVPESSRGKKVRCHSCGTTIVIPTAKTAPTKPAPAPGR